MIPAYNTDLMNEEDTDMKQTTEPRAKTAEKEEVFRCMTCGSVIGNFGKGTFGTTKCPTCRATFRLNFREDYPAMIRMAPGAK